MGSQTQSLSLPANVKGDAAHRVIGALTAGVQVGPGDGTAIAYRDPRPPSHINSLQLPGSNEASGHRHDDPGPDVVQIPVERVSNTRDATVRHAARFACH